MNYPIQTKATNLLTDSRFVEKATESIFFAIKGIRHDGHSYIDDLIKKGVSEFVVEKNILFEINNKFVSFENVTQQPIVIKQTLENVEKNLFFWVVENSTKALQDFVKAHREKFQIPVVGITGSNGKTIVKEWLSELLSLNYTISKSPRSYNSQIGVPLSVWAINEHTQIGIFEAGISQKNEMKNLSQVIQPTIGVFTNIGSAHSEGFNSIKEKIAEKLRLFNKSKTIVYCSDHQEVDEEINVLLKAINPKIEVINWSLNSKGRFHVETILKEKTTLISTFWKKEKVTIEVPFIDAASIENCIHVLFVLLSISGNQNIPSFLSLKPIKMRLEMKVGILDSYIIDDTYNNDLAGLEMALNFMKQHHTKRRKLLIISDILESGLSTNELYEKLKYIAISKGIDEIIGIGETISKLKPLPGLYFKSTDDFIKNIPFELLQNRFILLKGARKFEFEKIVSRLEQKIHGTVFEINLDALQHNLNFYRSKLKPKTKLMAMVKAYAYGSGSAEIAAFLQYHRVDYLTVAYTDEGVTLRKNGVNLPIMVLNPKEESYQNIIDYNLEPEIYSLKSLKSLLSFSNSTPEINEIKVHIKLDTGMHRLGYIEDEIPNLIELLKESKLKIASVFSHLAGADEHELKEFTQKQIKIFERVSSKIIEQFNYSIDRHICNTAGILNYPEAHFEMVRLGIGLYGVDSAAKEQNALRTIGTLKTVISQIKEIAEGETIGYGRKGKIEKSSKIATIALGYADGYDRGFGNGKGYVIINNQKCPTIGNICMDMTMVDVTKVACEEGDEAIIFGENPSISELASIIGTIPYEILTNIGERVKRVFYKE